MLPPAFLYLVQPFIHEDAAIFRRWDPAEACEVLKDTDLLNLFETGNLEASHLPAYPPWAPRHPQPDVVVQKE